jgi:hypothetical protein
VNLRGARAALLLGLLPLGGSCDRRTSTIGVWEADARPASLGRYIEAESGTFTGSFAIRNDETASGGRFI